MKKIAITFLLLFISINLFAANLKKISDKLDLSGFLRIRYWYNTSKIKLPGKFDAVNQWQSDTYIDLFFRNRINFSLLKNLEIKTVFDIGAKFGQNGFSISSAETNLITRSVYIQFSPIDSIIISGGLMPFSLTGGFILAADGAGFKYQQSFLKKKINIYAGTLLAFDSATDSNITATASPIYSGNIIAYAGTTFKISSHLLGEVYYLFEYDGYTDTADTKTSTLHWVGTQWKFTWNNFYLTLGGIFNGGTIQLSSTAPSTKIISGLWNFEAGYNFNDFQISAIAEGATGNPNNEDATSSFQDIHSTHGFSLIVISNSGGLAIRGAGESSWYGLYGEGARIKYNFLSFDIGLNYYHFRTILPLTWQGNQVTWFGDEIDLKLTYKYKQKIEAYLTAGLFIPADAYRALDNVQDTTKAPMIEVMVGVKLIY